MTDENSIYPLTQQLTGDDLSGNPPVRKPMKKYAGFIKLTFLPYAETVKSYVFINPEKIVKITLSNDENAAAIIVLDDDTWERVIETPEEIFALINEENEDV